MAPKTLNAATVSLATKIARRFGVESDVARDSVGSLCRVLRGAESDATHATLCWWQTHVAGALGVSLDGATPAIKRLAEAYGISADALRPAEMLMAVHTYYALIVGLATRRLLADSPALPSVGLSAEGGRGLDGTLDHVDALGLTDGFAPLDAPFADPFAWHRREADARWTAMLGELAASVEQCVASRVSSGGEDVEDLFGRLHQSLFPKKVRHALGEYYTPRWLAEHVLDATGFDGCMDGRLLDPSCGSGVFLLSAIGRLLARGRNPGCTRGEIYGRVVGFDLNPVAVLSARANYLAALRHLPPDDEGGHPPIHLTDSIRQGVPCGPFDFVVGNPPWLAWDHLPQAYRDVTAPLWRKYGLFSLGGTAARHGGAKKDLSTLMLYASADRYLRDGGRLGMVVTQTLLQTKGAGDGFRRFRLGKEGAKLGVTRVDDLTSFQPFENATNWTATIVLQKGRATEYPVPYVKWSLAGRLPDADSVACSDRFRQEECRAGPIDDARVASPWLVAPHGLSVDLRAIIGPSCYTAHLGANTGGANGVYWLDVLRCEDGGVLVRNVPGRGKRSVPTCQSVLEPDLIYPLLRWGDVRRYRAEPSGYVLLAQDVERRAGIDEEEMRARWPRTHRYLARHRKVLTGRAAYRRYQATAPFYSMYNVGPYTVSPVKVVWRRMDRRINAAVVEERDDPLLGPRPLVPQETCVLVAVDDAEEAYYLAALLNSSVVSLLVRSHSVVGGKGFGTPSMLDYLNLPKYSPRDPVHRRLARLARRGHELATAGEDLGGVEAEIDRHAACVWGLDQRDLEVVRRAVAGA